MKIKTILFTALFAFASFFGFSQIEKITYSDLEIVATQLNKFCPVMVDSDTRFDNCQAVPTNDGSLVFQYNYTLVNWTKSALIVTFGSLETLQKTQKSNLIYLVKNSNDMSGLRENNLTFNYVYYDKLGIFIFTVKVAPEDYKDVY